MSDVEKQVKSIVLLEGHVRWIMERETPEERLAAWETLAAIAFPENPYELPYKPPQKPLDGSRLSPCDRVRRDTYNMLADFINSRLWEEGGGRKNKKKVLAGKLGAAIRYGRYGSSSSSTVDDEPEPTEKLVEEQKVEKQEPEPKETISESRASLTPFDRKAEETEYFSERFRKIAPNLSEFDKQKIAEWNKKIPNAAAMKEFLERNWSFQNRSLVCSERFCEYVYNKLAREESWISPKSRHVLTNIITAIHWIALDFQRKDNDIKRAEEEEKRKDREAEFETKVMVASQQTNEDVADMQRISSRKAEREAMEKILRGEL